MTAEIFKLRKLKRMLWKRYRLSKAERDIDISTVQLYIASQLSGRILRFYIVTFKMQIPTVELVYCGHLGTNKKCPDYQGVLIFQVSLYDKAPIGTVTISVWIIRVSLFSSVLINRFHCTAIQLASSTLSDMFQSLNIPNTEENN